MQIVPFLTHYQLVYANFDFSSFSLISYTAKALILHPKSNVITMQKHCFYKACKILLYINRYNLLLKEQDFNAEEQFFPNKKANHLRPAFSFITICYTSHYLIFQYLFYLINNHPK